AETAEKFLFTERAQEKLHPVLFAVLALAVAKVDANDGFARRENVALGHEIQPRVRDLGRRAQSSRHVDGKPAAGVGHSREDADVVDHRLRFVAPAAGKPNLEFSRQLEVELVEQKMLRD